MKKYSSLFLTPVLILSLFVLQGCGTGLPVTSGTSDVKNTSPAVSSSASASPASAQESVLLSIEIYNRTGKIQREDFYAYGVSASASSSGVSASATGTSSAVKYSKEYSYDDSGRLTAVKRTGGELGSNGPVETYLYSGDNLTQHVLYDDSGSTQKAWYRTYDKTGQLTKERVVTMLPAASGTGYSGKSEEITEYDKDGLAVLSTCTSPGEWTKDEYGYDPAGNLITDNYYCSADGENWTLFETKSYFYDETGILVRETEKDSSGTVFHARLYGYDETGSLLSDAVYSSGEPGDENCLSRTTFEYNDAGLCVFKMTYSGNRSVQTYYEYNAEGKCVCVSETEYTDGIQSGTTVTKTEYDSRSNPVRETVTAPDGTTKESFRCSYEYYEDGKIKKKLNYNVM